MKRHAVSTRLWHWLNFACLVILFMSGLNISNAHKRLYWGEWGFEPGQAWLIVPKFPGWTTIPGHYSLADARLWHLAVAWPFALLLLFMWIAILVNGHFRRDLMTRRREWRWSAIRSDVAAHLRFEFDHGDAKFNFLQKLTYGLVLGVLLPGMIVTGLGISPGMEPLMRPVSELVGGRQSMRSLHFIFAWSLFGFLILHVALVLVSHPLRQMRDMITGGPRET
ncbi:cytochrome b/b6 domain-containing protein [Tsuneonella rigui]|uniref:cytochrome b/b6 domain-containing protein n=1 Tax=Tsuneonella rigui TaxID=1708790 RepID=UPI000F7D78BE|nr:cytochrome b/b6 domain-containing protein [Tsuneonella rigui]